MSYLAVPIMLNLIQHLSVMPDPIRHPSRLRVKARNDDKGRAVLSGTRHAELDSASLRHAGPDPASQQIAGQGPQ